MRLIVLGPKDFDDYVFVREQLNLLTFQADDVSLICGEEITFQLAIKWMEERWKKCCRKKQQKYAVYRYHFIEHQKKKDLSYKQQWREMVQDAEAVIAFWEPGNVDFRIKGVWEVAKLYDLKLKKILV